MSMCKIAESFEGVQKCTYHIDDRVRKACEYAKKGLLLVGALGLVGLLFTKIGAETALNGRVEDITKLVTDGPSLQSVSQYNLSAADTVQMMIYSTMLFVAQGVTQWLYPCTPPHVYTRIPHADGGMIKYFKMDWGQCVDTGVESVLVVGEEWDRDRDCWSDHNVIETTEGGKAEWNRRVKEEPCDEDRLAWYKFNYSEHWREIFGVSILEFDEFDSREGVLYLGSQGIGDVGITPSLERRMHDLHNYFDLKYETVKSVEEICHAIRAASKKLQGLIINAHGSPLGIQLKYIGDPHNISFDWQVSATPDLQMLQDCFNNLNGPIILFSCSTGKAPPEGGVGFGSYLSAVSGKIVISPREALDPACIALSPTLLNTKFYKATKTNFVEALAVGPKGKACHEEDITVVFE